MRIHIKDDQSFIQQLKTAIEQHRLTNWKLFKLLYQYRKAAAITHFDELKSLDHLQHITFLEHQIEAAKEVINEMNGRAILADEVGLGKTIEAGLILKEYLYRRLVKRVLILVPSSLVNQWVDELYQKFSIQATVFRKHYRWDEHPIMIASLDLAKRSPHREAILALDYDLVIVDEAHRLKNHHTINYDFVKSIKKTYCLLLTATPIQNNILEVFNLVSIIKPGLLGDYQSFKKQLAENPKQEKLQLKPIIRHVMVRNRRKDTILDNVKRHIKTIWLSFTKEEQAIYDQLEQCLSGTSAFAKLTYLKELCSSREACYLSLQKKYEEEKKEELASIMETIAQLPHHTKAMKLVELIMEIGSEKIIVFTQYRASQYYLQWYLQQHGIKALTFSGGLKRNRKDWITSLFKHDYQVLIATEAGGEGINLQFCSHMINYDLPWNPMQLEQRIGRIHRYGQKSHIKIYNLVIQDTLEEHVVHLLYEKIDIFEKVIGELDDILEKLQIKSVDQEISQIIEQSESIGEAKIKLNHLMHIMDDLSANEGVN